MENIYKILIINYSNTNDFILMIPDLSWNYQNDTINLMKFHGYSEYIIISTCSHVISGIRGEISNLLFEIIETDECNEEFIKIVDSVIVIFDENTFSNQLIEKIKSKKQDIKIIIFNNESLSNNKNKINQFKDIPEKVFNISLKTGQGIDKGLINMINHFVELNSFYKEYD